MLKQATALHNGLRHIHKKKPPHEEAATLGHPAQEE